MSLRPGQTASTSYPATITLMAGAMSDRIHATMDRVQSASGYPMIDRSAPEPERRELSARHHTVLASRKLGDVPVTPTWATSTMHFMVNVAQVHHWREDPG
jgi:hypothetical protein